MAPPNPPFIRLKMLLELRIWGLRTLPVEIEISLDLDDRKGTQDPKACFFRIGVDGSFFSKWLGGIDFSLRLVRNQPYRPYSISSRLKMLLIFGWIRFYQDFCIWIRFLQDFLLDSVAGSHWDDLRGRSVKISGFRPANKSFLDLSKGLVEVKMLESQWHFWKSLPTACVIRF